MDTKEEFANIIKDADKNREKSLILLIFANKSLVGLEDEFEKQEFDEEQINQINQLLDCVENIIDLWLTKLNDGQVKLDELIELIEESDLLNVFVNLFYRNLTDKFIKIEQILHKIISNLPIAKDNQVPFYLYLMAIADRFKQETGQEKFKLSEKLTSYLSINLGLCLDDQKVQNCIKILAESIYDILQNKLSDELRAPIFSLLATITYHYESLNWFIKPEDERRSFLLVSRLACIESRMCLETKLNDLNLLTSSLIIIEHSIKSLIDEDSEVENKQNLENEMKCYNNQDDRKLNKKKNVIEFLTNDDVIQLIDTFKLLMQSIVIYLSENQESLLNDQKQNCVSNDNHETKSIDSKPNYEQFQVYLRVLCLYLTFENEFLKNDFEKIITIIARYILNELPKTATRNNNLVNLCLTSLISIIDNDLNKYKQKLTELNLIKEIESQMNNDKRSESTNMFKSFLDSIS